MKHLLSGIAVAAVLALAVPASAQTSPSHNEPTAGKASSVQSHAPRKARHARVMHRKHMMKHAAMTRHHARLHAANMRPMHRMTTARLSRTPSDNVANQLNRQELDRMSGGSMPAGNHPAQQPGYAPVPGYQGQ
jgi:hypothetical protein